MHQFKLDPQAAMSYMSDLHHDIATQFLDEWNKIPTFGGPLDLDVRTYCDGLGNWVRANDSWSFEVRFRILLCAAIALTKFQSERYFGKQGLEIQATRLIQLNDLSRL